MICVSGTPSLGRPALAPAIWVIVGARSALITGERTERPAPKPGPRMIRGTRVDSTKPKNFAPV